MDARLKLIQQGPKEPLKGYISRFNKEGRVADNLQPWVMLLLAKDSVREGSSFFISISKKPPNTLEEFLKKVEKHINYGNVLEAVKIKMEENHNTQKGVP